MKKILYLMNLDWYWIKQRPQYIAENLSEYNDVFVVYKRSYRRKDLQKEKTQSKVKLVPLYTSPNFLNKYKIFKKTYYYFIKKKIKKLIKKLQPGVIYFSSIFPVDVIPKDYDGKILYDCMDDYSVLETRSVEREEKDLISKSDIVLVTSENLRQVIIRRYGQQIKRKLFLVRNGFNGPKINLNDISTKENKKNSATISYIGTVSRWFDFKILEASLNKYPQLEYKIIGPVDKNIKVPQNSRIHFLGTIEHDDLYEHIKNDIALVMPFKLNKIVESVDPVKLYEYINFDKNIITIKYNEIDRFKPFVYFYDNEVDYCKRIGQVLSDSSIKYNQILRNEFLDKNSWKERVKRINELLENKDENK